MADEKKAMIRVKDLKKEFGDNHVLRGINYEIEKGQKIVLVGPSASMIRTPTSIRFARKWEWCSSISICSTI